MRFPIRVVLAALVVFLAAAAPSPGTILPAAPKPDSYETAGGFSTEEPVVLPLSAIKQARAIPFEEEDLHGEGWEFYNKEGWASMAAPSYTSKHYFSVDKPLSPSGAAVAPVLKSKFAGIPNATAAQPDCIITVGPNHIMIAVNTEVAIYTKTGQKLFQTSFAEWFRSLDIGTNNLFDPKVLYDQYSGHYIFLCNARRADARSFFLFSVSKTSDPTGPWAFWTLDMQLNGTARQDILWADFPRLGVDEKAIYLTGNMTTFNSYLFKYPKLRILKKSQVYSFGKLTWRDFWKMKDGTGYNAYSMEPAHSYGPAPVGYLVNTSPFTASILTLWTVTGATTAHPVLTKKAIHVSSYTFPPLALQKGGGAQLATRECGVYNAVSINGLIYTAHNMSRDWGSGPVSAIRFYQVKTNGELVQEITYGADKFYYFYPAVTADSKGNVVMGFNKSSAGTFAGLFYTGRKATDPPGKFQPSIRLASGLANFKVVFKDTNVGRWGDYAGIALDANDSIYFYGQYASAPFAWSTLVAQFFYP